MIRQHLYIHTYIHTYICIYAAWLFGECLARIPANANARIIPYTVPDSAHTPVNAARFHIRLIIPLLGTHYPTFSSYCATYGHALSLAGHVSAVNFRDTPLLSILPTSSNCRQRVLRCVQIYNAMDVKMPARYHCQREREITRRQESGLPMNLTYDQVKDLLVCP